MKPDWRENFRSPAALLAFFGAFVIGLTTDLVTKSLAVTHLAESRRVIRVIPSVLRFEYTENHGAVFGLGQGQRVLFLIVSAVAIGFLLYLFATSGKVRIYQVILGMLLAGVLGNMYDRIKLGYVRDMLHGLPGVYWPQWVVKLMPATWQPSGGRMEVFPWIFNVADSLLCVGVAAMIVYSFITERQRKHLVQGAEPATSP